jgi:NAD(P)-dependent dehydrogenase (short-subunit alcohol dehydrogenase family)
MKIAGKAAVVTGGASGIGQAVVRAFVGKGGQAAIFDLNEAAGNAMVKELGRSVIFEKVNVADEGSVAAGVAKTMSAFGAIHVCVNCAGIGSAHKTFGKDGVFPL